MYLWALTTFFASAGISQDSIQKPMPFGVNTSMPTLFFHFFRTRFGQVQVAAVTCRQADVAARQFVNDGRAETFHVRTDGFKTSAAAFKSSGFEPLGIFTQVVQQDWEHFARSIPQSDTARFQLIGVFRFKQQIPAVFRRLAAQKALLPFRSNRQSVHTGEIRNGVLIARSAVSNIFSNSGRCFCSSESDPY